MTKDMQNLEFLSFLPLAITFFFFVSSSFLPFPAFSCPFQSFSGRANGRTHERTDARTDRTRFYIYLGIGYPVTVRSDAEVVGKKFICGTIYTWTMNIWIKVIYSVHPPEKRYKKILYYVLNRKVYIHTARVMKKGSFSVHLKKTIYLSHSTQVTGRTFFWKHRVHILQYYSIDYRRNKKIRK